MKESVIFFICIVSTGFGARILFNAPPESYSHRASMYPFMTALAKRGHEVVFWSETYSETNTSAPPGVTELFSPISPEKAGVDLEEVQGIVYKNNSFALQVMWYGFPTNFVYVGANQMMGPMTKYYLETEMEGFHEIANQHWDIIIIDAYFTNMGHAISLTGVVEQVFMNFLMRYPINSIVNGYIQLAKPVASYMENYERADAIFHDYPELVDWPKAEGLDLMGTGSSCALFQTKELPPDLEEFVNRPGSKGTILVAFGSIVRMESAPDYIREAMINAIFSLTEYQIIWSYAGDPPPNPPSHVKILQWTPQKDILRHPKTKLFVSHGGLKSFKECICSEKPILVIPLFGDQFRNAHLAKGSGIGDFLNKFDLTGEAMASKIREITSSSEPVKNVIKLKTRMLDRIIPALDEASFWTEFIIRRKGRPEQWVRKGSKLFWVQYWCLDVIFSVLLFSLMTLRVTFKCLGMVKKSICG